MDHPVKQQLLLVPDSADETEPYLPERGKQWADVQKRAPFCSACTCRLNRGAAVPIAPTCASTSAKKGEGANWAP